jgi:hypothetical protein
MKITGRADRFIIEDIFFEGNPPTVIAARP